MRWWAVVFAPLVACATPKPASIIEVEIGTPPVAPAVAPTTTVVAPSALVEPTKDQRVAAEAIARAFEILVGDSIRPGEPGAMREAALRAIGFAGSGAPLRPWTGELDKDRENLRDAALGMAARGKLAADAALRAAHAMADAVDDPSTFALPPSAKQGLFALVSGGPVVQPGIVLAKRPDGRWAIGTVVAGGAAAAAGAQRGDVVLALGDGNDRVPVKRGFLDLMSLYGAPAGTKVTLAVERGGQARDLGLVLGAIAPPILEAWVDSPGARGVGVVRLWRCTQSDDAARDAGKLLAAALADFDRKHVKRLVLDLRGNAGGYPFDVASLLVDADPLLVALGQDAASQPVARTKLAAWKTKRPIVVIVDEQTSTGAEMLAFVLREHAGARLVGRPTAGALAFPSTESIGGGISLTYPISRVGSAKSSEAALGDPRPIVDGLVPELEVGNPSDDDLAANRDPQLAAALAEAARS